MDDKSLTRLSTKCKKCRYLKTCNNKMMQLEAYIDNSPLISDASKPLLNEISQPMLIKHDYRDIKVGINTTITIDLEELKNQMAKQLTAQLYPSFLREAT